MANNQKKNPFAEMEEGVLRFWEENKIFEKSVSKEAPGGDYVFYDGPPFATGTPHYGHIVGSIMKDAIPRYWTMNGRKVERKWGWDCHGLPIENIVEKEFGSKSKKDIEDIGVDKFNEMCRSKVLSYVDEWEKVINRLGRWADMKNAYRTMDTDYMESIWWVFKQLYDKGLIYEGYRSMHVCPRCETTLSQQEVAEGYKDIKDLSAIAKFELADEPGTFVLAWTTTPWTLIGNVALAVGEDIDYVKVGINQESGVEEYYILAKVIYEKLFEKDDKDPIKLILCPIYADDEGSNIGHEEKYFKGSNLIGKKYKPLFNYYTDGSLEILKTKPSDEKNTFVVVAAIFNKKNELLLGRRLYSKDKPEVGKDFWIAPGGKVEIGESVEDALKRELMEECGITNFKIKKYFAQEQGYLSSHKLLGFVVEVDDFDQLKNNEPEKFAEWKFFNMNELPVDEFPNKVRDAAFFEEAFKWHNGYKIYGADFVTTDEGTGVVHIAPAFGEDDMNLGKEQKLPFIQHLTMDGNFKPEVKDFIGLNVKPKDNHMSTDIEIIKYLAHNNLLFHKEKYEHSYPHCWRCDTPLINYATSSWFVNVTKVKGRAIETAKEINWSPAHIKEGRFGNWLQGARDWSISRQRFWASVMPVWRCDKCGKLEVFGSVADLEKVSGQKISDLHKHVVDKVKFSCDKCEGEMTRIPDVLDTWFDSGSMPYAQMHYPFENKDKFDKNFPAEFIAEGQDQTRAWFYYLHIIGTAIKDSHAYNNVIVNGIVLAEDGKKMAKKLHNYPDPSVLFDQYGADALRYYLMTSHIMLADNLNFSEEGVKESLRKVIMILWNVVKFYDLFAVELVISGEVEESGEKSGENNQRDCHIVDTPCNDRIVNVLDKWILARFNQLINEVTDGMNNYNLPNATRPIAKFVDDLSTWYIRRSRDRFKGDDEADKKAALETTGFVLIELSKLIAPAMPFIAESVWQKVTGNDFKDKNKSVHLESWRSAGDVDKKVVEDMDQVRKIVEMGLAKRDEAGIKIRQPLSELRIKIVELGDEYVDLIMDELNVKNVFVDKVLKAESGSFQVEGGNVDFSVKLNTIITEELKLEGLKRELVRFINSMRKDLGLSIGDRVDVGISSKSDDIKKTVEIYGNDIKADVLADKILFGVDGFNNTKEIKVNGDAVQIGINN